MPEVSAPVWADVLEDIRASVHARHFETWFGRLVLLEVDEANVTIGVPNLFHREWIERHYLDTIHAALERTCGEKVAVRFVVDPTLFNASRDEAHREGAELVEQLGDSLAREEKPTTTPRQLNPDLLLENFVVGACNRIAFEAACQVVESPGTIYNPLFIHGGCGVGKTHLLQGVCQRFRQHYRRAKAIYIPGESFANQFVAALRSRQLDAFRHRFREASLLVIDDVHFLASKNRTQDELLHTFNALEQQGNQIVMASDQAPRDIQNFKESLLTRFMSGMVVELKPPSKRVRLGIVKSQLGALADRFEPRVLDFVVETFTTSVRELKGAVTTLRACAALTPGVVSLPVVRQALAAIQGRRLDTVPTAQHIVGTVCDYYGIDPGELTGTSRAKRIARPRQVAMHLIRELTDASYKEIARRIGAKNHTTAIAACRRINQLLESDTTLRHDLQSLKTLLRSNAVE